MLDFPLGANRVSGRAEGNHYIIKMALNDV